MGDLIVYYSIGIVAVLISAFFAYWITVRCNLKPHRSIFITLILASGYIFFAQYLKYKSLHMYVDLSHWLQILYSIITSGKPESLNQALAVPGTLNYLSVHFVPFIYVFALFFRLLPRPEFLFFLNVVAMLSAVIPLYKLAVLMGGSRRFALFIAALFLWYPTFQYITLYEFEILRLSIPLLLWVFYFWETRRILPFFLSLLFAVFVREEMGLTVGMFGLYLVFIQKERVCGWSVTALGFISFALTTRIIMPFFSGATEFAHIAAGSFNQFGMTPFEIGKGMILHPILVLQEIVSSTKFANLFMLFLPLLFIPFFAPTVLIGMIGNIGVGLVSNSVTHTSYMLFYVAPSVPFIFYAFLKAWPKVIKWLPSPSPLPQGEGDRANARSGEGALMISILAAVLVSNIFFGPSPISFQFWFKNIQPAPFRTQDFHWSVYRVTDHHRKAKEFVRMIPDEAIVSAPQFLHPRLYKKRGTMVFPDLQSKDKKWQAEYVLLDTTNNGLKSESPAFISKETMVTVKGSEEWKQVAEEDGYELYRRID